MNLDSESQFNERLAVGPKPIDLVLASIAVPSPMGQQIYEEEIARRGPQVVGEQIKIRRIIVRTLRSPLNGNARVPARYLGGATESSRRVVGAFVYRGADLVHRLDLRLPPARREIVTVHDVVSWKFDDEGVPPGDAESSARRARAVICPSQFSADEVAEVLGVGAPYAIPNGVDDTFFSAGPLTAVELQRLGIPERFVLYAGGSSRRKNLAALAEAWPKVRGRHRDTALVLAGPSDARRERLFGAIEGAVRTGRVPRTTLVGLVASASAVVVPSIYEGFGLPALEAMAAGAPVVAARCAALPEVCGDAAMLVEPTANGLAEGLDFALSRGPEIAAFIARGRARAAQFTWQASAEAHARLWAKIAAS